MKKRTAGVCSRGFCLCQMGNQQDGVMTPRCSILAIPYSPSTSASSGLYKHHGKHHLHLREKDVGTETSGGH